MGAPEVEAFLSHLAVQGKVAPSTQNQALNAIVFLYRQVLKKDDEANRIRVSPINVLPGSNERNPRDG